jgi:hypothetical protein
MGFRHGLLAKTVFGQLTTERQFKTGSTGIAAGPQLFGGIELASQSS